MCRTGSNASNNRLIAVMLLALVVLFGLGGCLNNNTTNPAVVDPTPPSDTDTTPEPEPTPEPTPTPTPDTTPTTGVKQISAGANHNCAIKNRDGSLWCWGNNSNGQLGNGTTNTATSPSRSNSEEWRMVSAGGTHSCGLKTADTSLLCWGDNQYGQLGNGDIIDQKGPVESTPNHNWKVIATGATHACSLAGDGRIWCWGDSGSGQLGYTPVVDNTVPTEIDDTLIWSTLASGTAHTCAIKPDDTLWCWGDNTAGQLGHTPTDNTIPSQVDNSQWASVAANGDHTCAIKATKSSLWCWGDNTYGQLGQDPTTTPTIITPTEVDTGTTWSSVATGIDHSCGIQSDDTLWCWGNNDEGQLGDGSNNQSLTPKQIGSDTDWSALSLGNQFTCAIKQGGSLWCWGINTDSQLGHTPADNKVPSKVGVSQKGMVSAGNKHACAIKTNDLSLWCWGDNTAGQLGQGDTAVHADPVQEITASQWLAVSARGDYTCAIRIDTTLWCWGDNGSAQLGNGGLTTQRSNPTLIASDAVWNTVDSGTDHSCGIKEDGSLWCWGNNTASQLGDGTTTPSNVPIQVQILSGSDYDWSEVELGNQFSCALKDDSSLWCWGDNSSDQMGRDDSATNPTYTTPVQIDAATDWATIAPGGSHACALMGSSDSYDLYCWGDNSYGQLGQGSDTTAKPTPTQISGQWLAVATGTNHTCAIKTTNDDGDTIDTLYCWGDDEFGQLGIDSTAHQPTPRQIDHDSGWLSVTAGANHTCAIDENYISYCWGLNDSGQLGNGAFVNTGGPRVFDASIDWYTVDSGRDHTCGLREESGSGGPITLWCGGLNDYGQLGIGSTSNQAAPVKITGASSLLENWSQVSVSHYNTCAITDAGALYCWGRNTYSQLATLNTGNVVQNWIPNTEITAGATTNDWIKVVTGANHTCGIKNTDELWCWGDNSTGQIGNGTTGGVVDGSVGNPIFNVPGSWLDVAVGGNSDTTGGHTCAIKTDNTLWCWGKDDVSQLGDGSITDTNAPAQIIVDTVANGLPPNFNNNWESIKAGNYYTCGMQLDKQLYCWGDNSLGQTGTGAGITNIPKPVSDVGSTWETYDLGEEFACGVTSNNAIYCWGSNDSNQLTSSISTPPNPPPDGPRFSDTPKKFVSYFTDWKNLAMGRTGGCGIRENTLMDRTAWCWGNGAQYQLGDGSAWKTTLQLLPLN
jgi:alpha-tubulin suppressor-like RCC1 family protein